MRSNFKLSDPREYRRGVVLGLTLAEVLVLLVFLLLLSMSALLLQRDRVQALSEAKLEQYSALLAPLTKALASRGVEVEDTDRLASLIERGNEADALRSQLVEASRKLDQEQAERTKNEAEISRLRDAAKDTSNLAREVGERDALAAILQRVAGPAGQPLTEKLEHIVQVANANDAAAANLVGQNAQMRTELARLKGNGGSGLPYCWTLPDGRPQFMLKVEMRDNGVVVHDLNPRSRPEDPAWASVDGIVRESLIPMADFISQTSPLQTRSAADRCRYAIEVVDGTGVTNKPGYKQSMGRLWSVFMVREIPR